MRQLEEEYHRFLAKLPVMLIRHGPGTDSGSVSGTSSSLWNAAETTAADRKQILRRVVERVVVAADKASEHSDVTIVWKGGAERPNTRWLVQSAGTTS